MRVRIGRASEQERKNERARIILARKTDKFLPESLSNGFEQVYWLCNIVCRFAGYLYAPANL